MNERSDYCRYRKRQVKELSKLLAKEMISRANKKAIQLMAATEADLTQLHHKKRDEHSTGHGRQKGNLAELMEDIDLSWVSKSERFKNFTR
jgi:hypothetical protein